MAPKVVYRTNYDEPEPQSAFNKDVWPNVSMTNRKIWWSLAKSDLFFAPYVVEWLSFDGKNLSFRFVDHATGKSQTDPKNKFDVVVDDKNHVYWGYPSTIQKYDPAAPLNKFGFLMLSAAFFAKADPDQSLAPFYAGGGQGKWPAAASSLKEEELQLLRDVAKALRNSPDVLINPLAKKFDELLLELGLPTQPHVHGP